MPAPLDPPPSKPPRESFVSMTEIVQPGDTNSLGTIFGGKVVSLMDIAAAVAAIRHTRRPCVTASIDRVDFVAPIRVGWVVNLFAAINFTSHKSLEVGVRVESENPLTGERHHTATAFLTFVALGEDGKPTVIPQIAPETDDERARFEAGRRRHDERKRIRDEEKGAALDR